MRATQVTSTFILFIVKENIGRKKDSKLWVRLILQKYFLSHDLFSKYYMKQRGKSPEDFPKNKNTDFLLKKTYTLPKVTPRSSANHIHQAEAAMQNTDIVNSIR